MAVREMIGETVLHVEEVEVVIKEEMEIGSIEIMQTTEEDELNIINLTLNF